ncbi:uncharacterized protein [Antedon mediterranea]|uniref:uncharacterized protein n=1 Tax=Antedon mediterranea TaxID=105859 RepID=UPI003AF64D88
MKDAHAATGRIGITLIGFTVCSTATKKDDLSRLNIMLYGLGIYNQIINGTVSKLSRERNQKKKEEETETLMIQTKYIVDDKDTTDTSGGENTGSTTSKRSGCPTLFTYCSEWPATDIDVKL